MTVQLTQRLDPKVLTAVLVTPESLPELNKLLPDGFPTLTEAEAEREAKTYHLTHSLRGMFVGMGPAGELEAESLRASLHGLIGEANKLKAEALQVVLLKNGLPEDSTYLAQALGEMPLLSNYFYKPYQKEAEAPSLTSVQVYADLPGMEAQLRTGRNNASGTVVARDLVNMPPNELTSVRLAERCQELAKEHGFSAEVFDKAKIEKLGLGGLLAVNLGSSVPPTFTILEHKPANANNAKPYVLVGKGITFDTGGMSLKPPNGMTTMKCDMAGAAAVIGTMVSIAKNELPVHVIALVPSTDNRPSDKAYVPQDVIKMHDGSHVEVLNTDAEGRLILADALSWAKQYEPELVIDLATLTGSAVIAVGSQGTAMMSTADAAVKQDFLQSGFNVHERLVELPLWKEYREQLKSDIADLKNVGGREAGSITAGKFLEHFTDYPWIHLDIAGSAYLDSAHSYRPKNGTGVGVRLIADYLRRLATT